MSWWVVRVRGPQGPGTAWRRRRKAWDWLRWLWEEWVSWQPLLYGQMCASIANVYSIKGNIEA